MLNFVSRNLQLHYANSFLKCCSAYESLLRPNVYRKLSVSAFQKDSSTTKLARQPVPNLDDKLVKYLKRDQPFLSPDEYKVTEALVNDFNKQNVTSHQLHKYLEERASKEENWLSESLLNCAYLEFRKPVTVWSSPGLVFPLQSFGSALSYKELIDENEIPQDKLGNDLLDIQQYNKIFGTCRIPRPQRDQISYNSNSKHIIVMLNNHVNLFSRVYPKCMPFKNMHIRSFSSRRDADFSNSTIKLQELATHSNFVSKPQTLEEAWRMIGEMRQVESFERLYHTTLKIRGIMEKVEMDIRPVDEFPNEKDWKEDITRWHKWKYYFLNYLLFEEYIAFGQCILEKYNFNINKSSSAVTLFYGECSDLIHKYKSKKLTDVTMFKSSKYVSIIPCFDLADLPDGKK